MKIKKMNILVNVMKFSKSHLQSGIVALKSNDNELVMLLDFSFPAYIYSRSHSLFFFSLFYFHAHKCIFSYAFRIELKYP